jgi:hypothetical protein
MSFSCPPVMSSVILCFILSCRLRLLSPIRCVIFFYIVISTWNLVFYPRCPKFNCCLPHSDYVPLYPMYRMLYIAMPTRYVLFYSMCLFQFDYFLHPMCHKLYIFILSRMCSFIVCFILSGPFVTLSHLRCVIYLMMSFPPECVPLSYVSYVLHCLLDCVPSLDMASSFYCHMLYIVISTCDVSFHAMVPGFYFILCSRIAFPIRCVICFILSCPPYVLFYSTCSMFYFTLSIRIAIFIRCVIMCHHAMSIRDMLFYSM